MKSCLSVVSLLIVNLSFHYASGRNPFAMKSVLNEESTLELECSECITFMNKVFDAKRNNKEMQDVDLKTARSMLCPENPAFPICHRNEVSIWEDAFLTPELGWKFCTSLPKNDCNRYLANEKYIHILYLIYFLVVDFGMQIRLKEIRTLTIRTLDV